MSVYFYWTMKNGIECKWKDTNAKTKQKKILAIVENFIEIIFSKFSTFLTSKEGLEWK